MKINNADEIMERAQNIWKLYENRSYSKVTFDDCLQKAQKEAEEEDALNALMGIRFKNGMELTISGYRRILTRWKKGGYDRVYINATHRKTEGYVDIKNNEEHLYSNVAFLVDMATVIKSMVFEEE
ncbi:hypothetical protein LJC07_08590 [Christensenellaceae bacterium OttesenSCG-928-L17]|nr:hypothetical protein [Christensenellaceae bacterium OttesenSCG-928-L17]